MIDSAFVAIKLSQLMTPLLQSVQHFLSTCPFISPNNQYLYAIFKTYLNRKLSN